MKSIITIILITLLNLFSIAQDHLNYKQVDTLSYNAYILKDWESVTSIGEKAIKQDIDYFYLRMRLGISYYEQNKYRKASQHFEKALEFNTGDSLATEYLFYSYKFSGQDMYASLALKKSTSKQKHKFKEEQYIIKNAYIFYGQRFFSDNNFNKENRIAYQEKQSELSDTSRFFTEITYPSTYQNIQFGLEFRVQAWWRLQVAYQYFKTENITQTINPHPINTQIYQTNIENIIPIYKDYYDSLATSVYSIKGSKSVSSSQIYIKNDFALNKKLEFSIFGDIQSYNYKSRYQQRNINNDTIVYFSNPPGYSTDTLITDYSSFGANQGFSDKVFLLGFSAKYIQPYYELSISSNILTDIDKPSVQTSISGEFFPFGGNKLAIGIAFTYIKHKLSKSNTIYTPFISYSPIERVNITVKTSFGKRENWQTNNGYSIYNGLYKIHNIYNASINIRLYKTLYLKILYEYLERSTEVKAESTIPQTEIKLSTIKNIKFDTHSIISGLIWEF